jgi:hypothetical protein
MKLRLFLFLFFAGALLTGRAMAQGCSTNPRPFPLPGAHDIKVNSEVCIANVDAGTTGQGGRLRWDNSGSNRLELFDSDDSGQRLWCANNGGTCAIGKILCLQQDGNMVIYNDAPGNPAVECDRSDTDHDNGTPAWASNTQGDNDDFEELLVAEDVFFCTNVCTTRFGDRAIIQSPTHGVVFVSLGYND